jgi:hypothetical protein
MNQAPPLKPRTRDDEPFTPTAIQEVSLEQSTSPRIEKPPGVGPIGFVRRVQAEPLHSAMTGATPPCVPESSYPPTATQSEVAVQEIESSPNPVGRSEVDTTDQPDPFHCSARGSSTASPTAKQSVELMHETPKRLSSPLGLSIGTTDHVEPFHCSASVASPSPGHSIPTVSQSVGLRQVTAVNAEAVVFAGASTGTAVHDDPVHSSAKLLRLPPNPTAIQKDSLRHETDVGNAELLGTGRATVLHDEPFQKSDSIGNGGVSAGGVGPTATQKVELTHETEFQLTL